LKYREYVCLPAASHLQHLVKAFSSGSSSICAVPNPVISYGVPTDTQPSSREDSLKAARLLGGWGRRARSWSCSERRNSTARVFLF